VTGARLSLISLVLAFAAPACRAPHDPVVLRFRGVDVRRSDFLRELAPLAQNGTDISDPTLRVSAFDRFVEERVVAIAAAQSGVADALTNHAEGERWLASALRTRVPTEEEARAYYEAHPEVATVPESVTIREILLSTQQDARDVVRILGTDRKAFELLARSRSRSPQAVSGGLLGSFRRGELPPEIEQTAFSLAPGQISGIVTTSFGYHVLRVESKVESATRTFEESRADIEARLSEARARLRMKELIDGLVSQSQVNYEAVASR
jgi:parvulin-like peptidyl-prolyl isomerase